MTKDTTLVILSPGRPGEGAPVPPGLELLGLPLVRRNVLSAVRAGIERIVVVADAPETLLGPLEGTPAALRTPREFEPPEGRTIFLAGHVLADSAWLKELAQRPPEPGALLVEAGAAALLERPGLPALAQAQAGWDSARFLAELERAQTGRLPADQNGRFVIASPGDVPQARDWLLQRLVKSGDSALTRLVSRPISLAISRRLAPTRITPNQVTIASVLIGLASTPFFLSSDAAWQVAGAALLLVHNTVDGCDGELARLKFQSSHRGMILDLWGDNVVHAALFTCMGIGWSLSLGAAWPLVLAALGVAGTLGTAWLVYRQTLSWTSAGAAPQFSSVVRHKDTRLSRVMNAFGNRDFLYGVFVLALFGKAQWLLPLVAVGTPLFSLGLVVLAKRGAPSA